MKSIIKMIELIFWPLSWIVFRTLVVMMPNIKVKTICQLMKLMINGKKLLSPRRNLIPSTPAKLSWVCLQVWRLILILVNQKRKISVMSVCILFNLKISNKLKTFSPEPFKPIRIKFQAARIYWNTHGSMRLQLY